MFFRKWRILHRNNLTISIYLHVHVNLKLQRTKQKGKKLWKSDFIRIVIQPMSTSTIICNLQRFKLQSKWLSHSWVEFSIATPVTHITIFPCMFFSLFVYVCLCVSAWVFHYHCSCFSVFHFSLFSSFIFVSFSTCFCLSFKV